LLLRFAHRNDGKRRCHCEAQAEAKSMLTACKPACNKVLAGTKDFKDFKVLKVETPLPFGVASRYVGAKSRSPTCKPAFVAKRELRF
jgi:hypothetical protein